MRIKWTPEKLEEVRKFVDEEIKEPEGELFNFRDGYHRHNDLLSWSEIPIIGDPNERQRILKEMFYDETEPTGMTKMIQTLNKRYIGFKAREVREFIRKQQAYQDSRIVFK